MTGYDPVIPIVFGGDQKACDYIQANRQRQQHEVWQRYVASLNPIEDIDKFFQDPEAVIELRTHSVAKLVTNQFELKQFLLKFCEQEAYGNENRKLYNTCCVDYFSHYIAVDGNNYINMTYTYEIDWTFENDDGGEYNTHFRFEMDIDPPSPGRNRKYPEDCEPSYSGSATIEDAFITDAGGKEVNITANLSDYLSKDNISEIESDALKDWKDNDNSYDGPDFEYGGPELDYI